MYFKIQRTLKQKHKQKPKVSQKRNLVPNPSTRGPQSVHDGYKCEKQTGAGSLANKTMGRTAPTGTCCEDTLPSQAGQTDVPVRCGASSKHNPRPKGYNPSAVPIGQTRRKGRERTSFPSGPTGISEASKRHLAVHTLPSHLHPPFSGVLIKVARGEKPAPQTARDSQPAGPPSQASGDEWMAHLLHWPG